MRHGHALSAHGDQSDGERALSDRGREEVSAVAQALREAGVTCDVIVSSPLLRARQTAELVAQELGVQSALEQLPELSYTASPELAAVRLTKLKAQSLLAVGHMPTLPSTLRALSQRPTPGALNTAQVVCLEDGEPQWTLAPQTLARQPL